MQFIEIFNALVDNIFSWFEMVFPLSGNFHLTKKTKGMKTTLYLKALTVVFFAAIIFISSCKKAEEAIEMVSEEEAAEAIENSISSESGGLTLQIEQSIAIVNSYIESKNDYCGMSFDSVINIVNPSDTVITYYYNLEWEWVVHCNQYQLPESVVFSYDMEGGYDAPRMSADDFATQSLVLSGLELSSDYLTYNGSYEREGTCQSKIGEKRSFSSKITFEAINVQVDKATGKLVSGAANVSISAKTSDGKTFSFDGVITFTGGDTATLTLENEFVINL